MEIQNLKNYLKETYELEGQFYIYKQIEQLYKKTLNELDSRRNTLYWFEEFAGEKKEDSEILNINFLAKNIENDTSYNRGNAFLLPLRWRTSELYDIIEKWRSKINASGKKHIFANTILNNLPQKRQDARCRLEVIAYAREQYAKDLSQKEDWTTTRIELLSKEYKNTILPCIQKLKTSLQNHYSANIISESYRSFEAVSMLYQYIDTGRCTHLDGDDGAYNLFQLEVKQKIIVERFDILIFRRNTLSETMEYAMHFVDRADNMTHSITKSLGKIATNTDFADFKMQSET